MTTTFDNIRNYFAEKIGNTELGVEKKDLTNTLNNTASQKDVKIKAYAFDNKGILRIIIIPYYEAFYIHLANNCDFFDSLFELTKNEPQIQKMLFFVLCPANLAGFEYEEFDEDPPNNKFSSKINNIRFDAQEKFDIFRHKTFARFETQVDNKLLPDFKLYKNVRFVNSVIPDEDFDKYFPMKLKIPSNE